MAAQDVRELIPRVRRALEGPVPTGALTDDQILAVTADAIADVILFTGGEWKHTLAVTHRDNTSNAPDEWSIDPPLTPEEESVVAYQAAITYLFVTFTSQKTSERIVNEGQEWEWTVSATVLRDHINAIKDARDKALEGLVGKYPVFARYESILAVRDAYASAVLEPWVYSGGLGGGQLIYP
jgi:hypothetical protein